uniref:Uncharacterized protein n=1 Tax=Arundo donax TaxID=35708 RepID=A0A0A9GVE0_ARUDO
MRLTTFINNTVNNLINGLA